MASFPLIFLAPVLLSGTALLFIRHPGRRPGRLPVLAEASALGAVVIGLASLVQFWLAGPQVFAAAPALSVRLDAISVTLALLVGFVGWVVIRYARRYLDGEAREGRFHALTLAAIAAVLVLVQAGSLPVLVAGFVATGVVLRQLLLFYPGRAEARRAAAKFARVWGAGDLALILAAGLFWWGFGTADIAALGAAAGTGLPVAAQVAAALLVLAAVLKTATFPVHGWLTEVMEAPTPVSALLHAGIINSGGVLLITLAALLQAARARWRPW
jgi:NAD(P)H-quinone oxidoreductase subunit 5